MSEIPWLPEHHVSAVVLTSSDAGGIYLRSLFRRRLLEAVFDGDPEAVTNMSVHSQRMKEGTTIERAEVSLPCLPGSQAARCARSSADGDAM